MEPEKPSAFDNGSDPYAHTVHPPIYGETTETKASWSQRFVDSFKRDPNSLHGGKSATGDSKGFDVEGAVHATAESPLARKLKGRHLQMIAIGGSIGTSFSPNLAFSPSIPHPPPRNPTLSGPACLCQMPGVRLSMPSDGVS
jgi:hypothetical protein